MVRITLCSNCLGSEGVRCVEVGSQKGNQFDNWREEVWLCGLCEEYLIKGLFTALALRNKSSAIVTVSPGAEVNGQDDNHND